MLVLKFDTVEQLNEKIAQLFVDELGDKPTKILESMAANNAKVDLEVAKMREEAEAFAKTAPSFLQAGIMEQTEKAIADYKATNKYQDPMPTLEAISANLLKDKIQKVKDALGVEEKIIKTRGRKAGDASFNDVWAVKFPNNMLAVNFRKLNDKQKVKFNMKNALEWVIISKELGWKVAEVNSPSALVKLAYNDLAGGTGNQGRHPWNNAKKLTEQDIAAL